MDEDRTNLRTKSLDFHEGWNRLQREGELTSSCFGTKNSDGLLRKDKDLNGNCDYLTSEDTIETSNAVICQPLSKLKQNNKHDGVPVLELQGGFGTSDPFEELLSKMSNDNYVTSVYTGCDMPGYVSCHRECHATPTLCQEQLSREDLNDVSSHDIQQTRNTPQDVQIPENIRNNYEASVNLEKCFEEELQFIDKGIEIKFETKITEGNGFSPEGAIVGDVDDVTPLHVSCYSTTVPSQAESLQVKNCVLEEEIVPITKRSQPVSLACFEESITPEDDTRRSCVLPNDWDLLDDDDKNSNDEIIVIAVCDDSNAEIDDDVTVNKDGDDNTATVGIYHRDKDDTTIANNIRLTDWYHDSGCHGDNAAKDFLVSYNVNYTDNDSCQDSNDADDGFHGNKGLEIRSSTNDTENHDDDDDDDDETSSIKINGGNPFDLDESEFQNLMQSINTSSESISDNYSDDHNVKTQEDTTGNLFEACELTEDSSLQTPFDVILDETASSDSLEQVRDPFSDYFDESSVIIALEGPSMNSPVKHDDDVTKCVEKEFKESQGHRESLGNGSELSRDLHQVSTKSSPTSRESICVSYDNDERNVHSLLERKPDARISGLEKYGKDSSTLNADSKPIVSTETSLENELFLDCIQGSESKRKFKDEYKLKEHDVNPLVNSNTNSLDVGCDGTVLVESSKKSLDDRVNQDEIKLEPSAFNIPVVVVEQYTDLQVNNAEHRDENPLESQLELHNRLQSESNENALKCVQPSSERDYVKPKIILSMKERIQKVNEAFEWVRNELKEMRALDFKLKVQFDGLRQEARTLREEYESYINCEYYDDDEIFDEATEYMTCTKESGNAEKIEGSPCSSNSPLNNGLREDCGYHSDTLSTSTDPGSTDNENSQHTTHTHAKYYYQPLPKHPKIQELTSGKCVFELLL